MKIFVLLIICALANGQNYCSKTLCPRGDHIGCNNDGDWSPRCPPTVSLVDLGPFIETILESHNEKRNKIASGELRDFKSAAKMATMQWDPELASLAELNVKQCLGIRHDTCHSTANFKYSGQNLGLIKYTGYVYGVEDLIISRLEAWWNEYKRATPYMMARYPSRYSGPAIGHFTVMAAEKNIRVGCAASHYSQNTWEHFLLVCNYATTNFINVPIYVAGKTAADCTTGTDSKFVNLCSKSEKYSGL